MKNERYVLTVIGKDKPGIIAHVTGLLFRFGCNLEDATMSILEGEFAMVLIVHMPRRTRPEDLKEAFLQTQKKWKLELFFRPFAPKGSLSDKTHQKGTVSYLISGIGRDRTGIVYQMSRLLADKGFNITDLNSRILGRGQKALYSLLLEVDIPKKFPLSRLEKDFKRLERKLQIEIKIRPAEALII